LDSTSQYHITYQHQLILFIVELRHHIMPSRKKSKGKAKKGKAKASSRQESATARREEPKPPPSTNDLSDVADSLDSVLSIENMMSQMRGMMVSSLGEGYDAETLQSLDRKLCGYILHDHSFYYDNEKNKKSSNPEKPTKNEFEHYKKSDIIRKRILRKAGGIEATTNYLGGQVHKNRQVYQEFYEDLMNYHYMWFEIIFEEDNKDLLMACSTVVKFAALKLDSGGSLDELHEIMALLREIKVRFQLSAKSNDMEACEDAGILEFDFYESCYKMSVQMAKSNRIQEADDYFGEALMLETSWGYYDESHCAKVLEFAIGKRFCPEDLADIEDNCSDGFYYRCLQAYLCRRQCSVSWNPSSEVKRHCH